MTFSKIWSKFDKKTPAAKELTRVQKRVKILPTGDLLRWADQISYSIGRNLAGWERSQHPDTLEEARLGAESLHAILDALTERNTNW